MPAYKYTLKSGKVKWRAMFYYTDWTGERKPMCKRGFNTKREADEYERFFLARQNNRSTIPFPALVENYLEDQSHRLKYSTMDNKKNIINTKILPYFEKLRTSDIDSIKVRQWQNTLMTQTSKHGKPYSPTYLRSIHSQLSAIFNYACTNYGLAQNPCRVAGSIGQGHAEEMKIWTVEEFNHFLQYEHKSGMKLAFEIFYYTGIRLGELLGLTPANVLPSKKLDIQHGFDVVDDEEVFTTTKNPTSVRCIAIPDFLYQEIMNYIDKLYGIQPDDRIFYFTKSGIEKEIKEVADKAGMEPIRLHDLRHSHASLLIENKIPITDISKRLGHKNPRITLETYAHLYKRSDQPIADALDNIWEKSQQ